MAVFMEKIKQQSGMVLGGIGTGSIELFPDGELHEWQIYNTPRWASCCREAKVDDGEAYKGSLSFFLRTEDKENGKLVRRLGLSADSEEFTYRMFTAVKPVQSVEMECRFPSATLRYHDSELPCYVSARFTSPFLPHDEEASASPAFCMTFTVENPNDYPIKVSLAAKLKTDFCNLHGQTHEIIKKGKFTYLSITPTSGTAYNDGSLALSVSGDGKTSYLSGDYTRYLDEYVSHSPYGIAQESFLFPFLKTGKLPDTGARSALPEDFFLLEGNESEEELDRRLSVLSEYAFAGSLLARIRGVYPAFPENAEEKRSFLAVCQRQVRDITRDAPQKPFGGAALCRALTLKPGECKTVRFVFAWHFPHHYGEDGRYLGHYYATKYENALAVALAMNKDYERIFGGAEAFSDLLYDTSLSTHYSDAWSLHLSTLVKDSWWLKDGSFGLWEGLGYCGFATTDITYHASFSLAALFPALQKKQMLMTAAFQRDDGRMPHFFTPDLYHVDDGFHRVDMNPQFVLLCARDFLLHGDRAQLASLWQPIKDAMDATARLDQNNDSLPDTHTAYNTYDAWHFEGTPSYIAFLWLSALKAACRLAVAMKDADSFKKWQAILKKGLDSLEKLLFNGKYYDLWTKASLEAPDGERDACLMSDQLDGETFLRLIGLGGNLPDKRYASVLRYIHRHNFKNGEGLVNASCPQGITPTMYTYLNCQAEAHWTGIAYLFAASLDSVGDRDKAENLIRTVHKCQSRVGHFFNHWECGFRYTRPLSSWATLLAASGVTFDEDRDLLSILPPSRTEDLSFPLVSASGTAHVAFEKRAFSLECRSGMVCFRRLRLPKGVKKRLVTLETPLGNRVPLYPTFISKDDSITADFSLCVPLTPDSKLLME